MILEVFYIATLVFLLSYYFTRQLSLTDSKKFLFDHPNERSLHSLPVARTGGVAILTSFLFGLIGTFIFVRLGNISSIGESAEVTGAIVWVVSLMLMVGGISLLDDHIQVPVVIRLILHILASIGIVWGGGMYLETLEHPFGEAIWLGRFGVIGTVLFLTWMTNLYNFMDGMDGFAGGMTIIGFSILGCMAWVGNHFPIVMISFLISAATLGFLWYNLPPAKIFMGDAGSAPIGFLAGVLSIWGIHDGVFQVWCPLLVFSPFIVDATVTLVKRLIQRKKVWHAHREHFYQRLVLAGWGHQKTMRVEYLLMMACGLSAVAYNQVGDRWRSGILLGWIVTYVLLGLGVRTIEQAGHSAQVEGVEQSNS